MWFVFVPTDLYKLARRYKITHFTSCFAEMGDHELEKLDRVLIDENADAIPLSYQLLERITNNFSDEIGRGGFGVVYKVALHCLDSLAKVIS